jgi:predicted phage terminase large subunit-like protein
MAADGCSITPQEAAREILRRRRARATLVEYSQAITIPGAPASDDPDEWLFKPIESAVAKHHRVIMQAIERCIRTDYGRLMIFAPPGSAKSTYASTVATTWAMGNFPGIRVLMTSYAATPIIRHSKRARQIAASAEYAAIWEHKACLIQGSKAADEFELTNGSGLFAAGLLGGLTSNRCDLGIIDDPVAGREEADSETIRIKTRAAYEDDFLTRLKPKASIILIQTRWHQDDLAGSILPEDYDGRSGPVECRDGQVWEVLNIAACAEREDDPIGRKPGEFLWPEWFGSQHWAIYQRNPRTWASLYQQRPTPDEGIYFAREDFKRYAPDELPTNLRSYMASDFAVKELKDKEKRKRGPDCTEHGNVGVTEDEEIYFTGWWSGQKKTDKTIDAGLDLVKTHKPTLWFGEKGVIENAIEPSITARMRQRKVLVKRELLPSVEDKAARVAGFAGRVAAGMVYLPYTTWADELIEQLCAFPAGRYDDKVDVCSLIGRGLDMIRGRPRPSVTKRKPIIPFTRAHFEMKTDDDERSERQRSVYK